MLDESIEAQIRQLAKTLVREGLQALRVADGDVEIELSRSATESASPEPHEAEKTMDPQGPDYDVLISDVVGRVRFLRPPVTAGMPVDADRELAFVEALGIRNPVRSRGSGRVAVVYVEEGQAVDYGAPLFAIDRSRV